MLTEKGGYPTDRMRKAELVENLQANIAQLQWLLARNARDAPGWTRERLLWRCRTVAHITRRMGGFRESLESELD